MDDPSPKAVWTPLKIIQWAVPFLKEKGISSPKLEVELFIAAALGIDRLKVYLQFDRPLDASELALIRGMLKRRAAQEPIQYIMGRREFFGLSFQVEPGVLIPRPETEDLVERAVEFLKGIPEENRRVLDLGTGSGCIAISVAKTIACRVWAVDQSVQALEIARKNAQVLGVESSIEWRQGDWFSALRPSDPASFELILSNPPYIPLREKMNLDPQVRDWEPSEALFSGSDGLDAYREISMNLKGKLPKNGVVLMELYAHQADKIAEVFRPLGWKESLFNDLQGLPRVLKLENDEALS